MNAKKTEKSSLPSREKNRMSLPQKKLLAACVGVLFAQCGVTVAWADSAAGVDTALGNAMNPPGRITVPYLLAEDGYDTVRRSPTGQLYGMPIDQSSTEVNKSEGGWLYSGSFEFGFLGGSPDAKYSKFRQYKDLQKGPGLNYFDFEADKPDTAYFIQASGGGVGRNDQFYNVSGGKYNSWKIKAFYNETPHVFSNTFRPIYSYGGGNRETLNPVYGTAIAGTATTMSVSPETQSLAADQEIALIRKKAGLRADWALNETWKFYATASQEQKKGERPYGFMAIEGVEPINYKTSDFLAGLQYFNGKTAVNLRASLSIFQNDLKQLYVESPLVDRAAAYPVAGVANIHDFIYTLPPDNKAASIKADASHRFDFLNSRLTGGLSWTTSRNDDPLRMPLDPGFLANGTVMAAGGTAADWNGVNGCPMSRCNSDLRVDSKLYNLGWSMDPTDDLTLRAGFRRFENDNKSPIFYAANPLVASTTSYGAPFAGFFNTASAFSALGANNPTTFTASYFSVPRSDKRTNYTLSGEYLFARKQAVDLALEREEFHQTYRERDNTWENKIKATYVNRGLIDDSLTLRASFENDRKRGSFYDPLVTTRSLAGFMTLNGLPYSRDALKWMVDQANAAGGGNVNLGLGTYNLAQLQTAILGNNGAGGQANSGGFMKVDEADRDQNIFNGRLNWSAREDLDFGLNLQIKRINYPGNNFGLQKDQQNSYNLDVTYQPAFGTQITAYYSRQEGKQQAIDNYGYSNDNNAAFTAATLPVYVQGICGGLTSSNIDCWLNNQRDPRANIRVDTKNTTDVFGFSAMRDFGWARMGLTYNYMRGKTSIAHQYGMNGGTALTAAQQAALDQYGDWPSMATTMQSVEFNLVKQIDKRLTARFLYRYENFRSRDWHYDFLNQYAAGIAGVSQTNVTPADMGPINYHVNMLGFFLQYKL